MKLAIRAKEAIQALSEDLKRELDLMIGTIVKTWEVEHDEEGGHKAITAESITLNSEADDPDGNFTGDLIPSENDAYDLGAQKTGLEGSPVLAWRTLRLTKRIEWFIGALSAQNQQIPSWSWSIDSAGDFDFRANVANLVMEFLNSVGTLMLRIGSATINGSAGAGIFTDRAQVTNLGVDSQLFIEQIWHVQGKITPAQITGNQNNYNPTGLSTASFIRLTSDAVRTITGIVAQTDGRRILLSNAGAFDIQFTHNDTGSSTAANCFFCPGGATFTLNPGDSVEIHYDDTGGSPRWWILAF